MTLGTRNKLEHLQTLIELVIAKESECEQRFIINNVAWNEYNQLLNLMGDQAGVLLKYSQDVLEIMSPSSRHEIYKKNLGMLLETYFQEKQIRFYALGSTTFRSPSLARGIEPDQCYCIGTRKEFPDLAIEIIITSGGIDCLKIYQALSVPEVWLYQEGKLAIYKLQDTEYFEVKTSHLFPELPIDMLVNYIPTDEPFDAVLEWRNYINS